MNTSELPFDTEKMIAGLRLWVEAESPSYDPVAVNKVIDLAAYDLASVGATLQRIPGRMGFGDSLRGTINPSRSEQPGILICGHADTVHEIGRIAAMPYRRESNNLWGPGLASMKAGIYLCLEALRQLTHHGITSKLPVTVLIVSDKECGCPSSRELIEATARNNRFVLVPDCVDDSHGVIVGRHAQDRYNLDVKVDAISAGDFSLSAISEMARQIVAIDELSTEGCKFKVAAIESGKWVNCADKCTAEVITQAYTEADVAKSYETMMALNSPNPDKGLHVNRGISTPLWQPLNNTNEENSNTLLNSAREVGCALGLQLNARVAAGGTLGNITGAMGIATLDGLGAVGEGAHSPAERIKIDSLVLRGKLMAGLLANLA